MAPSLSDTLRRLVEQVEGELGFCELRGTTVREIVLLTVAALFLLEEETGTGTGTGRGEEALTGDE